MKKIVMLFFVFSFVLNLIAQKNINLDTLNINQLILNKEKAVKLRNTGMILTLAGGTVNIVSGILFSGTYDETNLETLGFGLSLMGVSGLVAVIGIPLWITGGVRKSKAEIAIKKFDIKPENSLAVGLGLTLRF
jgi:hypothetical protein